MSTPSIEPEEREVAFDRLGTVVRTVATGEVSPRASVGGREWLVATLAKPAGGSARGRAARRAVSALVAMAVLVALYVRQSAPEPWSAESAVVSPDGFVSTARPDRGATLRFRGGASIALAGDSRARVVEGRAAHAHVVLEAGRASVRGKGHPQPSFRIDAGAYTLACSGAALDVSWNGETMEARVTSGTVLIEGPALAQSIPLRRGQSMVVHEPERRPILNDDPLAAPNDEVASETEASP